MRRSTAELWPFVHRYAKKEDRRIVLVLFQSEASIPGLDERDNVWDHLNQITCLNFLGFPPAIAHSNRYSSTVLSKSGLASHVTITCPELLRLLLYAPEIPNTKCVRKFVTQGWFSYRPF